MDGDPYDAFGRAAELLTDPSIIAGRYSFQRMEEKAVPEDVRTKLTLSKDDRLLEIGCGTGKLLLPLSGLVGEAVGVDHPACLAVLQKGPTLGTIELVAGRWPGVAVPGRFSKVLAYSVLHYLEDKEAAFAFIEACLEVMLPGARLLLGDLPNHDAAARFKATAFGAAFVQSWSEKVHNEATDEDRQRDLVLSRQQALPSYLGDDFVVEALARYRRRGYEGYVLPQPAGLPFCHTREDLLIVASP